MCLASKFEDKQPISTNTFQVQIGHNAISMEDIISTESRMFKVLSFSVSLILAYDILTILIENFVSKNLEEENLIKEL